MRKGKKKKGNYKRNKRGKKDAKRTQIFNFRDSPSLKHKHEFGLRRSFVMMHSTYVHAND